MRMNKVTCPRCGVYMDLLAESESMSGEKVIRYFYRCPACGYRLSASVIKVKKEDDSVVLSIAK
jgi:C4-type Zn-finger protein